MVMRLDYKAGIHIGGALASVVAGATGTLLHDLPANRSAKLRRVRIYNHNGATTNVSFGAGLAGAFVASTGPYQVLNGMDMTLDEDDLGDVEYFADITVSCTVAGAAPANVEVQAVDVEEFIGTSG